MRVVLNQSLHLVVSVQVQRVSRQSDLVLLQCVMLESLHDKLHFDPAIRCEDISRVDFVDLKVPRSDDNNLLFKICDVNVCEFGLEIVNCFSGEIARDKEETIGDEEMREGFLDEALDLLLRLLVLEELGEVSTILDDLGVELFES